MKIDFTEQAKNIFGDIVDYAYIQKPSWDDENEIEEIAEKMKQSPDSIEPSDGFPAFVKFTNNHSFTIWSSEWGGVNKETEEDFQAKRK